LDINDVNIHLDKQIISQLGPFFENEKSKEQDNSKAKIELTLQNCKIEIMVILKSILPLAIAREKFFTRFNQSIVKFIH
jgi:hypothetical protein